MPFPLVLIAEDDDSVRMALEIVLEDEGFRVIAASDGAEALRLAREERPRVMLLDRLMPRMSGPDVLRTLRDEGNTEDIAVFALSGLDSEADEWAGAHIIGKPFDIDDLVKQIRSVLSL